MVNGQIIAVATLEKVDAERAAKIGRPPVTQSRNRGSKRLLAQRLMGCKVAVISTKPLVTTLRARNRLGTLGINVHIALRASTTQRAREGAPTTLALTVLEEGKAERGAES